MEEHGGGLEMASEEGRGAQAIMWLPLSGAAVTEAAQS